MPRRQPEGEAPSLVITSERDRIDPHAVYPIEHVLAGSSSGYQQRRLEIVDKYYEVVE